MLVVKIVETPFRQSAEFAGGRRRRRCEARTDRKVFSLSRPVQSCLHHAPILRPDKTALLGMGATARRVINTPFTVMSQVWRNARRKVAAASGDTMAALILVVDDDPIQRRLLEAMAQRSATTSRPSISGEAALARLEAADRPPVNLVILDLVMPDLDGMGVLERAAPARNRGAGDRADRAWLDRGRHLGDARGRDRFRRQAGRRRAAAGVDQERAQGRRARGRTPARQPAQRRRAQLPRHRQPRRDRWRAPSASPSGRRSPTSRC